MAEIEKKYSDYQQSDCEAFETDLVETIDDKLCPTCQPDPNFKLEGNWWEIEEAYLNKKYCEYHVRVYQNDSAMMTRSSRSRQQRNETYVNFQPSSDLEEKVLNLAAGRFLVDFDKPLNSATRTQTQNACYIKDTYIDLRSTRLGASYLVAIPSFNFDKILPKDDERSQIDDESNTSSGGEIILSTDKLFRKLRQLRLALKTYEMFYSSIHKAGGGFVIREEEDETKRINFSSTIRSLRSFVDSLNEEMREQGYAKLNRPGLFSRKRAKKIKIIFKSNDNPFDLKDIYLLPDDGCGKYEKLKIKRSSKLKKSSMAVIYNFLQNLDSVINDITAKERTPWLDFTIKHFYPKYIVDYGDVESINDTRSGLECLLENQLGIGNGQIIDSLLSEIMSAFDNLEKEMAEEICRSLKSNVEPRTATELADQRKNRENSPKSEREAAMLARYEKEYQNQFVKHVKNEIDSQEILGLFEEGGVSNQEYYNTSKINIDNVFEKIDELGVNIPAFKPKDYNVAGEPKSFASRNINDREKLNSSAKLYSMIKFRSMENAEGIRGFGNQIQNSPHFQEAIDAARETLKSPENTFIQGFKDAVESRGQMDILDVISAFGVCGMTKLAGKALECLLGGVTFDRFAGILIDKTFDFMQINTMSLFMNGLPADFREDLNDEIKKQFGDIKLSDLFELKKSENPNQKFSDFSKTKANANNVLEILVKLYEGGSISSEEQVALDNSLPQGAVADIIDNRRYYNITRYFEDQNNDLKRQAKNRQLKPLMREKRRDEISQGIERIKQGINVSVATEEDLDKYSQASNSFQETALGVKVDAVYDVIIDFAIDYTLDYFGVDDILARLQKYPIVDFVAGIVDRFLGTCEMAPIIYPPPGDFLKGLSVDICNPTLSLTLPKINIPSISIRFWLETQFAELFREAIIKLVTEIVIKILKKLLSTLEGALCNLLEAAGGFSADLLKNGFGDLKNSFYNALNEAFCNDGEDPETAEDRAKALADALFSPYLYDSGEDYEGAGARVANVISSVASTEEFLEAMIAEEGDENDQFNNRVANAVNALTPEMSVLLGDPAQVAYFFKNLGSYLAPEDRDRIRDLLNAGIPNLPLSPALCLTNDQLNEWDNFRKSLLGDLGFPRGDEGGLPSVGDGLGDGIGDSGDGLGGGRSPQDIVDDLNKKTEDALADIFDIVGDLETDGPFLGSITNEMMKDICNPSNIINAESQSSFDKEQEDELVENFFDNIQRSLGIGFFSRGGILSEALRDKEDRTEFVRGFFKIFNGNYMNSQAERDLKYSKKGKFGKFLMDLRTDGGEAIGVYPDTVGIKQRKELIEEENVEYKPGTSELILEYSDEDGGFEYGLEVSSKNSIGSTSPFDYSLEIVETIDDESETTLRMKIPVSLDQTEIDFMSTQGFQIEASQTSNARKELFTKMIGKKVRLTRANASLLYDKMIETIDKNLIEGMLTDYNQTDEIPVGYKFGYVSDSLTKEDFKYTPSQNQGELGTFGSPRIIPLRPELYGGSYKRPAFYVEPRVFTGWVELGMKAFKPQGGCDPKKPALFDMRDIKDRVKTLNSSLRTDPRLTKAPDCISVKPFHLLIDNKNKAKLDGVVRTTIRTYIGEYFIKGYGLFSNLQIRSANFDQALMLYIVDTMKKEMQDLGFSIANKKVRIVKERYWYTFLEQSVEAYQRMIDVDGIQPPQEVLDALNKIQLGLDKYRVVDKKIKKKMREKVPIAGKSNIKKPNRNYDPLKVVSQGMVDFCLQSVAFRLSSVEERENFFDGKPFEDIQRREITFASLKKLQFFQKIYFIKLFEKEAILIMSELVRSELDRLASSVVDGINDKPNYYDLYRSFFGMKSFFPKSSSKVGLNEFYVEKQTSGTANTGKIPDLKSSNVSAPEQADPDDPKFIIESYVRLKEREGVDLPRIITDRPVKYRGAVSLKDMDEFLRSFPRILRDKSLSDYFGDLSFLYEDSISRIFDKGFANRSDVNRLIEINKEVDPEIGRKILSAFRSYVADASFEDFEVLYDESFLLEGEDPTPSGTTGSTGVSYGMRLSVVLPSSMGSAVRKTPEMVTKSAEEKAFFFEDGVVTIPLVETEVDVKDDTFRNFNPVSGNETYDLECLINKMVNQMDFQVLMDRAFNFKQASSMLAIYCMETLPAAIGQDESEREEVSDDPDVDDWDRIVNKFAKNLLRREFKSLYLANHPDGQSPDDDDDDSERSRRLRFSNPFDFFSLPSVRIPWWYKRRMKTRVYDANGQECADPKKDLQ